MKKRNSFWLMSAFTASWLKSFSSLALLLHMFIALICLIWTFSIISLDIQIIIGPLKGKCGRSLFKQDTRVFVCFFAQQLGNRNPSSAAFPLITMQNWQVTNNCFVSVVIKTLYTNCLARKMKPHLRNERCFFWFLLYFIFILWSSFCIWVCFVF